MSKNVRHILCFALAAALCMNLVDGGGAYGASKDRIGFWVENYDVLLPETDSRAERAHQIFQRVLNAAGSRPGVLPRLVVIRQDPYGGPTAFALPDGGIVISKGAINICYRRENMGDDRLAFVLAHEIAHQINEDFWHLGFFGALDLHKSKGNVDQDVLEQIREAASRTDERIAKELQADQDAIRYASMAGFSTKAVVSRDKNINFFVEWVKALDPTRLPDVPPSPGYLSAEGRANAILISLGRVDREMDLFRLGVLLYQAGRYCDAADAFEEFLPHFPSREVYHNLAACHHQLALGAVAEDGAVPLRFKLSLAIDTRTLAGGVTRGGMSGSFKKHLGHAIEFYEKAIELDPQYVPARNNLGCAYLAMERVPKGIGELEDALNLEPTSVETMNNLGIGRYLNGNQDEANRLLLGATRLDPDYTSPLYNLAQIAHETGDSEDAKRYGTAYLAFDSASPWAARAEAMGATRTTHDKVAEPRAEAILNITIGDAIDELPGDWAPIHGREIELLRSTCGDLPQTDRIGSLFTLSIYANGVLTVTEGGYIVIMTTLDGFRGESAAGIAAGSSTDDLRRLYGPPMRVMEMSVGECWLYDDSSRNITFVIDDGAVRSWLVYE